jgi:hypothetical protein
VTFSDATTLLAEVTFFGAWRLLLRAEAPAAREDTLSRVGVRRATFRRGAGLVRGAFLRREAAAFGVRDFAEAALRGRAFRGAAFRVRAAAGRWRAAFRLAMTGSFAYLDSSR